ncbi:Annexin, partial [Ostertagia ostertagi]
IESFTTPLQVASETSGEFRDLLCAIVTGSRDPSSNTNDQMAKDDAIRLYADGKGKLSGKDTPSHFLNIMASQNQYQLRKIFAAFAELSGSSIEKLIEKEFSGDPPEELPDHCASSL